MNRLNYKLWNQNDILELKTLAESGKFSYDEIGLKLNRTKSSCQGKASSLGIKNPFIFRLYSLNENFFAIPNEKNCFWAGFIGADGCLKKSGQTYVLIVELAKEDECVLQQLQSDLEYQGIIQQRTRLRQGKLRYSVRLDISNSIIGNDLINNFNIIPQKTKRLEPPSYLDNELLLHWLKGYISGDGTVFLDKECKNLTINVTSSSEKVVHFVKQLIDKNFPEAYRQKQNLVKKIGDINCYVYCVNGIKACFLFDRLRKLNSPKLDRKWNQQRIIDFTEKEIEKYNLLNP